MTGSAWMDRFLRTDPRDVGCAEAMRAMHQYVELARTEPAAAQRVYPGLAAHLDACGPCHEDFDGLRAAVREPETGR